MMNPMVGLPVEYGAVTEKVHRIIFPAMKRYDGGGGVLELPETKVGWPECDTITKWFVGIENTATP